MKKFLLLCLTLILLSTFVSCGEKSEIQIPTGMKLASDTEVVDYYFFVPNSWTVDNATGSTSAYFSTNDPSSVNLSVFKLDESVTDVDTYWKSYSAQFGSVFGEIDTVKSSKTLLDGNEAMQYDFSTQFGETEYSFTQVACIRNSFVYIFTYTSVSQNFEAHADDVQSILTAFKFM